MGMGNLVSGRKIPVVAVVLALLALAAFLMVTQFNSTAEAGHQPHEFKEFIGFWRPGWTVRSP